MATVIAVSSWVARGAVGLRAVVPVLERFGHEAIALPTVVLSNHLGHAETGGGAVAPETLDAMIEALDANGWLARAAAVVTGYLPSADHVRIAEALIARVRAHRSDILVVCDPVLGDAPGGLYVPEAVAAAVRKRLLPVATHLKPNAFELAYLSGQPVASSSEAVAAARTLAVPVVLASSVPAEEDAFANVLVTAGHAAVCTVARVTPVPHGTGDLLTALFVAHLLGGHDPRHAVGAAAAGVAGAIAESTGADELILGGASGWLEAAPLPMAPLAGGPH
jgi:pyridoxine kinase